jgi:mitogen-activated protein kinase kinase
MLLQHGWLASLSKPQTIAEDDEDEDGAGMDMTYSGSEDPEVAEWVKNALERKKKGLMGESQKPALHAAPLDTISPMSTPSQADI